MLLEPSERVIIMQEAVSSILPGELLELRRAGVKTIYLQGAARWGDMQPKPGGAVDWRGLDGDVEKCVKAGLKVLLPQPYQCPSWKPDAWFLQRSANGIPNMADPQAREDILNWTRGLIERYGSPQVQVVYSVPENGEFPDSDWPTGSHPVSSETITSFVVEQQKQLVAQFGEVWTAFHHYGNPPYIDPIYRALKDNFPACPHYSIQFTHFVHSWGGQDNAVRWARDIYGVRTFGGSEYVHGMECYLDKAIREGVGYITCPNHSFQPERRITPAMLETIGRVIHRMEAADA